MISDLWSEAKISNLLTLHGVCWNIGILGQGIQKWHYLSFWPLRDHQILFLNSLTQETYISINIMENRRIQILASDQRSEVIWWPLRGQNEKQCHFWIPWPLKPIFQHTSFTVSEFKILIRSRRSEVIWWPPRGQNEKILAFLDSLAQKTYISIYIMQNEWIQNFGLWSEVGGQRSFGDLYVVKMKK